MVQGCPVRNEPELAIDHELHPNPGYNLKLAVSQTHGGVGAADLPDSREPTATSPGI